MTALNLPIPASPKLLAVITAVFAVIAIMGPSHSSMTKPPIQPANKKQLSRMIVSKISMDHKISVKVAVRKLAGPYAHLVIVAAHKVHVPPRLVAAVIQVENGGNFHGSASRVSGAGAIGVMQLEPNTAWNTLRVNPWNARQNIDGGARYLAMMLHQFGGNVRLALMAYNAGPTWIANGGRPFAAEAYAKEVMRDAGEIRHA